MGYESVKHDTLREDILDGLNELRKESSYCDVTLIVGGKQFPAHKAVLCVVSSYFKTMFSSNFMEATSSEVKIEGNSDAFGRLLDFAYSGELHLTPELYIDIIELAGYLQFTHALEICASGLSRLSKLGVNTDIIYRAAVFAQKYGMELKPLERVASNLLTANFEKFSETDMFLTEVTLEYVEHFLDRNDLTAFSTDMCEEKVLKAVGSWLKHDWDNRKVHAERLLKKIRLGVIPVTKLTEYITEEMRTTLPECRQLVDSIVQQSEMVSGPASVGQSGGMFARRGVTVMLRIEEKEDTSNQTPQLQYLNMNSLKWTRLDGVPKLREKYFEPYMYNMYRQNAKPMSLHSANGCIYVAMCEDGQFDGFFKLNEVDNKWTGLPKPDIVIPEICQITQIENYLYVGSFAKRINNLEYNVVQRFNVISESWEELPLIPVPLVHPGYLPVVFHFNDKLLVSVKTGDDIRDMYMYIPATKTWVNVQCARRVRDDYIVRFFESGGRLYRVLYEYHRFASLHAVHRLACNLTSKKPSIRIEKKMDKVHVPCHYRTAIKIGRDMFIYMRGNVHKIDIIEYNVMERINILAVVFDYFREFISSEKLESMDPIFTAHTFRKVTVKMNLPSTSNIIETDVGVIHGFKSKSK